MFDKFLSRSVPVEPVVEPEPVVRPKRVYNRKVPRSGKYPKRHTERHDANGRVKKEFIKNPATAGNKQWKARRKILRGYDRKKRATPSNKAYVKRYNGSLRRKYIQSRFLGRRFAAKRGLDPDVWYSLTYEEWVILWKTTEDVFIPDKGFVTAIAAQGTFVTNPYATWCSRLDSTKPWSRDNAVIRFKGEPLSNKLNEVLTIVGTQDTDA